MDPASVDQAWHGPKVMFAKWAFNNVHGIARTLLQVGAGSWDGKEDTRSRPKLPLSKATSIAPDTATLNVRFSTYYIHALSTIITFTF